MEKGKRMPKGTNQKFKLYRLAQILLEKTDEEHYITMPQIIEELEKFDITAERKSLYTDIKALEEFGIEVEGEQRGKQFYYHVIGRKFELAELKLLVDSIQASKFITVKKTNELIKKLKMFCSDFEAKQLQRQLNIQDRVKTMNESIYYSVDAIHLAISENRKIRFKYYNWNYKKEMVLRRNGTDYIVSPWSLSWDDDNYYLVAYDDLDNKIKHYRVDKMLKISVMEEKREGKELFQRFNGADYATKNFSMFGGEEKSVTVKLKKNMCGIFIDRFGKDINFISVDDNYCTVRLQVAMSDHFLGWIFALGEDVEIIGPNETLVYVREFVRRISGQYL